MKIFVLLSRVPYPLDKGDKLRAFHQIKELSKKHEIILCALSEEPVHPDAKAILTQYCKHLEIIPLKKHLIPFNIFRSFLKGQPLQVGYFYQGEIRSKIENLVKEHQPGHIYCQLIRVLEYVKHLNIPITLDYMDALSKGIERRIENSALWLAPVFKLESKRLMKYERHAFGLALNKTIISGQDRSFIGHSQNKEITIIPNGVDVAFFIPKVQEEDFSLVFTGNMNYPPNIESAEYLAKEILPEVQKVLPEVNLLISGVNPSQRVKALASESVTVTGWVEDIRDSYARAKIFVAPMRIGTGLQNKLLEAMAMKKACITSELANNALGAIAGEEIYIGKNTVEYAALIIRLLQDDKLRNSLAEKGNLFVNKKYNWAESTALLENLMFKGQKG
jgi:polysaccharide biosynthesis protein PslH